MKCQPFLLKTVVIASTDIKTNQLASHVFLFLIGSYAIMETSNSFPVQ